MTPRTDLFMRLAAVMFGLLAVFNITIGAYHTILFATQGAGSLFSTAYGIPASPGDMKDPARLLGNDAIEVYSILLGGYGVLSLWATFISLRGRQSGYWVNTVMVGIAQLAILYGLILPGRLTGTNAYAGMVLYLLGVLLGGISLARVRRRRRFGSSSDPTAELR